MTFQPWHMVGSVSFVECGHSVGRGKGHQFVRDFVRRYLQYFNNWPPYVRCEVGAVDIERVSVGVFLVFPY